MWAVIMLCIQIPVIAQQAGQVSSPDKSIAVNIWLSKGQLQYAVFRQQAEVLQPSLLGLSTSAGNFVTQLQWVSASKPMLVQETYNMVNAKKQNIRYVANEIKVVVKNAQQQSMHVVFRVSNDGVAFRYVLPWINSTTTILEEHTTYTLSTAAKGWLQPMSVAKTGWERCHPSYEEKYMMGIAAGTPSPMAGWVYPALFQTGKNWLLITETDMDGRYCGTRLSNDSGKAIFKVTYPDPREVFTNLGHLPQYSSAMQSPWRILTIGTMASIAQSTLGTDLAPAAAKKDYSFVQPGKASWSWINSKDDFIVYDEQKRYIDYAAQMKWQYCLIDADWDTKIGYEKVQELAKYAATKNVGLLLWYNSAGDWNTVKYHPKGLLLTKESRQQEFARLQAMGIKGIKIDFFGGDGQSMMQYYIDILEDAADYKLLINFHGATLPRGWHKTYPHLMTAEAIYGMEMVTFEQSAADNQPAHCTVIPFTRNAFDPMDFTPMNLYKLTHSKSIRRTSGAFELALSVLFLSGIQHYAENPDGMRQVPVFVQEFLQQLPNHWEDVRLLQGFPGKEVVMARKSGNKWYIAGINGEAKAKSWALNLHQFGKSTATIITDVENGQLFGQQTINIHQEPQQLSVKGYGGFVMVLE